MKLEPLGWEGLEHCRFCPGAWQRFTKLIIWSDQENCGWKLCDRTSCILRAMDTVRKWETYAKNGDVRGPHELEALWGPDVLPIIESTEATHYDKS